MTTNRGLLKTKIDKIHRLQPTNMNPLSKISLFPEMSTMIIVAVKNKTDGQVLNYRVYMLLKGTADYNQCQKRNKGLVSF